MRQNKSRQNERCKWGYYYQVHSNIKAYKRILLGILIVCQQIRWFAYNGQILRNMPITKINSKDNHPY
jgi:hypothetical protein